MPAPTLTRRDVLGRAVAAAAAVAAPPAAVPRPVTSFEGAEAGERRDVAGLATCWCPPGRFLMGSPPHEVGRRADEAQVDVTLTRGFWMGRFEVTQAEWQRVVGRFPDRPPHDEFGLGDQHPVYWVSYLDAERFCAALTRRAHTDGSLSRDWVVTVPSEAQWEYACRADTRTATAFGDRLDRQHANFSGEPLSGGAGGPAPGKAVAVGSYPPNPWGLCDMHGNVFEWCRDWYHARLPGGVDPDLSLVRGVQNRDGTYSRVRRGGAWNDPGWACRSALRLRYEPHRSSDHIGFRVVAESRSTGG